MILALQSSVGAGTQQEVVRAIVETVVMGLLPRKQLLEMVDRSDGVINRAILDLRNKGVLLSHNSRSTNGKKNTGFGINPFLPEEQLLVAQRWLLT
jgi:hypothetical protein